jgi:hypothetical protein
VRGLVLGFHIDVFAAQCFFELGLIAEKSTTGLRQDQKISIRVVVCAPVPTNLETEFSVFHLDVSAILNTKSRSARKR